jgi:hypothetical protein
VSWSTSRVFWKDFWKPEDMLDLDMAAWAGSE